MYFKSIYNHEFENVIRYEHVISTVTIKDLDTNQWDIKKHAISKEYPDGEIIQITPLFNCNTISSSNSSDVVFENNKTVICINNPDTVITCY